LVVLLSLTCILAPVWAAAETAPTPLVKHGPKGAVQYLQQLPEHRGALVYGWKPTTLITPKSAFGCNGDVCISVIGESTTVDEWDTSLFGNVGCTTARFYINHVLYLSSELVCPDSAEPGVYYAWWLPFDVAFFDGDELCNSWDNGDGYPCVEIIQ
jgi:hypothetical protein